MKMTDLKLLFEEMLDILDEGVQMVDEKGNTIFYNRTMEQIEQMSRDNVLGRHFREVFSFFPADDSTLLKALYHGQATWNRSQRYRNEFGQEIHAVNTTIPVFREGKVIGAAEVARNVTDLMNMSKVILDMKTYPAGERAPRAKTHTFDSIIGDSAAMREAVATARLAADSNYDVLISGETGTGKELFAQAIHNAGPAADKPYIAQNCSALPPNLLEAILFGTAPGSITGVPEKSGLFEQAAGGTLLLDEISAATDALQSKLLRVLQERSVRPIGGYEDHSIDVRVIATINEPARKLIGDGLLRSDLYYRLNVLHVEIPPLRDRREDIVMTAEHLLRKHSRFSGKSLESLSKGASEKLLAYDYPGNVRELENIIITAVVAAADEETTLPASLINLPPSERSGLTHARGYNSDSETLAAYMNRIEADIINESLLRHGGNHTKAAAELGMTRQSLQYKLGKTGRKKGRTP
jgi:arginine utilization regulatory protein